ncbi:hypothetical protein, partial [Erwinia sp. V71]|uniref:hypothetical protein n=1 Tax=Erwinia sp. V71 TaxID=3369424 RepID=UPI003F611C89
IQATVCGVCRAKIGGLALHFGVESAIVISNPPYHVSCLKKDKRDIGKGGLIVNKIYVYSGDILKLHSYLLTKSLFPNHCEIRRAVYYR